jgi:hypothetical protein
MSKKMQEDIQVNHPKTIYAYSNPVLGLDSRIDDYNSSFAYTPQITRRKKKKVEDFDYYQCICGVALKGTSLKTHWRLYCKAIPLSVGKGGGSIPLEVGWGRGGGVAPCEEPLVPSVTREMSELLKQQPLVVPVLLQSELPQSQED